MVSRRKMRHGWRAIEYLEVCWHATTKSSIKIVVHYPSLFRILVHFFGSLRIPFHFFGSIRILVHFLGSFRIPEHFFGSIQNPTSISAYPLNQKVVRIPDVLISTYLLDQNILAHPWHLHFYVPTRPKYSCAPLIPPFLRTCTCLTNILLHTLNSSISTYLLDHNILAHPRFLHFYVPTWPRYSCAPSIPAFLHINSTIIFFLTRDTSISTYLLTKIFLRFLDSSIFTYQLDHHKKLCNVCYCLRYLVLCYPWRYNPWKFSWFWLGWFSVWFCSLDQWTRCYDWSTTIFVIHSGTIEDLWNHVTISFSSMNQHHPPL